MTQREDHEELYKVVDETCMDHYYVIHKEFFVNHLAHAQVALFRMGAPIEKIRSYTERFVNKLDPRGGRLNQRDDAKVTTFQSVDDLLGKQSQFYFVLDHFKNIFKTKYNEDIDEFIAGEFPKLSDGVGDEAIHPLIHIGYGYAVRSKTIVVEGMAFLHFGYYRMRLDSYSAENLGKGNKSLLEIAEMIQNDDSIYNSMLEKSEGGGFLKKMRIMMDDSGNDLLKYVHLLECPRESKALINWLLDNLIAVYTMAEQRNDFFLLHGITSCWALAQLLPVIKTEEVRLEICQVFLTVILAVYIGKDRPKLNGEYIGSGEMELTWEELRKKVIAFPDTTEEHRFKLVQVCYETALRDPSKAALCMKAAFTALDYHFHVGSKAPSKKFSPEDAPYVH